MSRIRYLLDTNIVIGRLKTTPDVMALVEEKGFDFDNSAISQITRIELLSFPRLKVEEERQIHAFLDDCLVILWDEHIERGTVDLRRAHGLKLPDAIIAATARFHELELLTLDRRLQNLGE